MSVQPAAREERGHEIEGWAFTFCKAAFLALLLSKYTLLVTASVAVLLYLVAAAYGVRDWRCFVKPPWVVAFFVIVAALQVYFLFFHLPAVIL
jgi:hypothetical protein